jgi:nicotinamide riboside kinase
MEENLKQLSKNGATGIIKIAIFGPESTGKTTLATQLADYYQTVWVPEFARDYLQEKLDSGLGICDIDDMLPIAYGQTKLENESAAIANKYLFCDTNLMVTKVFSELYYNFCDSLLDKAARSHQYDLFFLTDIDVPWEDDGLRDSPDGRESVFEVFKQSLIDNKKPFMTISGDKESRLKEAVFVVKELTLAKRMGFSSHDFLQIREHGISMENVSKQLNFFKEGFSKSILVSPATVSNGIATFLEAEMNQKALFFENNKGGVKIEKFVPASGAASRMFKFLTTFLAEFDLDNESINAYINRKKDSELPLFIIGLEKFPFYDAVLAVLKEKFPDYVTFKSDYKLYCFVEVLLDSQFFDYSNKPKALIPFHKYKTHIATAIEEHLNECTFYSNSKGDSFLHFTVSKTHQNQFEALIDFVKEKIELDSESKLHINYSYQEKYTDTIAVDLESAPFRDSLGKLVFRPGGHGSLIENINNLDSDIVFIKNIDNVIQNNIQKTIFYKKVLAGIMMELQQQMFSYLKAFKENRIVLDDIPEIVLFLKQKLNIKLSEDFDKFTLENKIKKIKKTLNRPIRVCGMVKNEGEPGGGPFWVRDDKGVVSLQIVESSQVDVKNSVQSRILENSTHFNPVDLVCGIKDYKGIKFDLTKFVDTKSGFIVTKSYGNEVIKAYELPGLWNGAMANWLTVFVEVPLLTFNPVKTVNDLLKAAHQPQ